MSIGNREMKAWSDFKNELYLTIKKFDENFRHRLANILNNRAYLKKQSQPFCGFIIRTPAHIKGAFFD